MLKAHFHYAIKCQRRSHPNNSFTLLQQVVLNRGNLLTPMEAVITQRDSEHLLGVSDAGMLSFAHLELSNFFQLLFDLSPQWSGYLDPSEDQQNVLVRDTGDSRYPAGTRDTGGSRYQGFEILGV